MQSGEPLESLMQLSGKHCAGLATAQDRAGRDGRLQGAGVETSVYDGLSPEPNHQEITQAAETARASHVQIIIGCGGSSALDGAKAVAVAATHPGPIMDYVLNGPRTITAATLPVIAISSTSGTGSHVGRVAVLSDRTRRLKRALISDFLYPRAVTGACLRHSRPAAGAKLARIARLLGAGDEGSDTMLADKAIVAIEDWIASLGLKRTLTEYGVPAKDHASIAREMRSAFGLRLDADPVPPSEADLVKMLQQCDPQVRADQQQIKAMQEGRSDQPALC